MELQKIFKPCKCPTELKNHARSEGNEFSGRHRFSLHLYRTRELLTTALTEFVPDRVLPLAVQAPLALGEVLEPEAPSHIQQAGLGGLRHVNRVSLRRADQCLAKHNRVLLLRQVVLSP